MSQQINLLGTTTGKPAFSFTSATAMVYATAIAAVLAAIVGVYEDYRLREVEAQALAVERKLKEARLPHEKLVADLGKRKPDPSLELKIAELNVDLRTRREIIEALKGGAIGSVDGFSEYMRAFARQAIAGLWLTGFDIAAGGIELTITGRALTADLVPGYLERLTRERSLQGRQFASMRISQSSAARDPAPTKDGRAQAALPAYLEFTLSSSDLAQNTAAPVASNAQPPLAPTLSLKPPIPATPLLPADSVLSPRSPTDNAARVFGGESAK